MTFCLIALLHFNTDMLCLGFKKAKNICVSEEGVDVRSRPFSSGLRRSRPGYVRPDTLPPNYRDRRGYGGWE